MLPGVSRSGSTMGAAAMSACSTASGGRSSRIGLPGAISPSARLLHCVITPSCTSRTGWAARSKRV